MLELDQSVYFKSSLELYHNNADVFIVITLLTKTISLAVRLTAATHREQLNGAAAIVNKLGL